MNYRLSKSGRRNVRGLDDLSRIERLLLEHVSRYRLTTRFGWRGAWELADFDQERIARSVRRLASLGFLRRGILFASFHYFELDQAGAALLTLSPERARPLTAEARYRAFAQLLYATTGRKRMVLADRDEVGRSETVDSGQSAVRPERGSPWGFFFEADDSTQWSQLLIDRSMSTNPNRVSHRAREAAIQLGRHPIWSRKLQAKSMSLAIITPSRRRAERMHRRFTRYEEFQDIKLNVMIAPGLIPLIQAHPRPRN